MLLVVWYICIGNRVFECRNKAPFNYSSYWTECMDKLYMNSFILIWTFAAICRYILIKLLNDVENIFYDLQTI